LIQIVYKKVRYQISYSAYDIYDVSALWMARNLVKLDKLLQNLSIVFFFHRIASRYKGVEKLEI
jgi:hypothetical protein